MSGIGLRGTSWGVVGRGVDEGRDITYPILVMRDDDWETLRRQLVRMARHYRAEEPEDVAQTVLTRYIRLYGNGAIERPPKYWFTAVRNEVIRDYRHQQVLDITSLDDVPSLEAVEEEYEGREGARELARRARRVLSSRQWEMFVLLVQGYNQHEMASRLGITGTSTRILLWRLRRKLRENKVVTHHLLRDTLLTPL